MNIFFFAVGVMFIAVGIAVFFNAVKSGASEETVTETSSETKLNRRAIGLLTVAFSVLYFILAFI